MVWESTFCLGFHRLDSLAVQPMPCSRCTSWMPTTPQNPCCFIQPIALGGRKKKKCFSSLSKQCLMYLAYIPCAAPAYRAGAAASCQSQTRLSPSAEDSVRQRFHSPTSPMRDGEWPRLTWGEAVVGFNLGSLSNGSVRSCLCTVRVSSSVL